MGSRSWRAALLVAVVGVLLLAGCSASTPPADPEPTEVSRTPTPGSSAAPGVTTARQVVLATQAESNGLLLIDPARLGDPIEDRIVVGAAPWDVEVGPDGGTAYVSTAEGLAVVDLVAGRRTALIPYRNQPTRVQYGEYRPGGMGVAVAPDGRAVYVGVYRTSGPSVLEVIDARSRAVVGTVEVGVRPFDVLISVDGRRVYTVDHDSFSVHVVDTATLRARRIEVAPFGTEGGLGSWEKPHYAVVAPDGDLLLPYQGRVLARLDPATGRIRREPMTANSHQHGATLTGDGRLLVVGTGAFGNATGDANLTVRGLGTGSEDVIPLDRLHETVTTWADPSGHLVAVLGGGYTRPGGWDGLTLIDLTTRASREIPIPGYPQTVLAIPAPTPR